MKSPKKELKVALADVKASAPLSGTLEKSKALSDKLGKTVVAVGAITALPPVKPAEPKAVKPREVIEFGKRAKIVAVEDPELLSDYESRGYMREYFKTEVNECEVTHVTSHNTAMILERLLPDMQRLYAARKEPRTAIFNTREIIDLYQTFGPAYGDICRGALRTLVKLGKVKAHVIELGRSHRYEWELLELVPPAPAKPTATEAPAKTA